MSDFVFSEPPPPKAGRGAPAQVVHLLAPLRDRPGQWARVWGPLKKPTARQKATDLKAGRVSQINRGEYEAVARELDDGWYVWVRYVKDDS